MRHVRSIVMMGLAGLLLMGCSHPKSKTAADVPVMDVNASLSVWQKDTMNPLLSYVPDDAPFVVVTQRGQQMNYSGVSKLMGFFLFDHLGDASDKLDRILNEFGLESNGKFDAVMYVRDYYAVFHITMADTQKGMDYFNEVLEKQRSEEKCYTMITEGVFEEKCAPLLSIKDEQNWRVIEYHENGQNLPFKFALHQGKDVLSLVVFDAIHALPDEVLSGVKSPYVPKITHKKAVFAGRIDYSRFAELLLKQPAITDQMDEEYWDEDDDAYGYVDSEKKYDLCMAESISCDDEWRRKSRCRDESHLRCPPPGKTEKKSQTDDYDDGYMNCSWTESCLECAENEHCYATLFNYKELSSKDRLHKIGKTSISDEVCVNEIKSLYQDYPVTEFEVVVEDTGAIGMRISTVIASDELIREMKSLITEHGEVKDEDVMARGFTGFKFGTAITSLAKRLEKVFENRSYDCSQLQMLAVNEMKLQREFKELMEDELWSYAKNMGSMSFVLKNVYIHRHDFIPQFWGYVSNSPVVLHSLGEEISKINEDEFESEFIQHQISGNSMILTTSPYSPENTKYSMVNDDGTFVDIRVRKDLVEQISDEIGCLVSDYHLYIGLKNNEFIISLMPQLE